MSKKDHNQAEEGKRHLKKFEIVETEGELPRRINYIFMNL